jgi:steroid 5-alpha reductase family enzyme
LDLDAIKWWRLFLVAIQQWDQLWLLSNVGHYFWSPLNNDFDHP